MRTEETLLLQVLKLKQLNYQGSDIDFVEQALIQNPDEVKTKMRNICAFISTELFDSVEGVCSMLALSKRRVVEMALIDFMGKAEKVITDAGAFPGQEH